jgi:hypothetical protein
MGEASAENQDHPRPNRHLREATAAPRPVMCAGASLRLPCGDGPTQFESRHHGSSRTHP